MVARRALYHEIIDAIDAVPRESILQYEPSAQFLERYEKLRYGQYLRRLSADENKELAASEMALEMLQAAKNRVLHPFVFNPITIEGLDPDGEYVSQMIIDSRGPR